MKMLMDSDMMMDSIGKIRQWLGERVVTVEFVKKDGSNRVMKCTTNPTLIPEQYHPKPKVLANTDNTTVSRLENTSSDPQLFKVFDTEKQGWRSFRYSSLKNIS